MANENYQLRERLPELDYLKCVFILLMITFHLVYIEQLYPTAKEVVYTFHMPGFLIISGYLMNVWKSPKSFGRMLLFLAIPYIIMESGYIVMASILPISDHIDALTPVVFAEKLFIHPLGPYWYLQTMIVCGAIYYFVVHNTRHSVAANMLVIAFAYYLVSRCGIVSLSSTYYFLGGAVLRMTGIRFSHFFSKTLVSVFAFIVLVACVDTYDRATIEGVFIVYCAICMMLYFFKFIKGRLRELLTFLGRNSLVLYIFSPIFTILCKKMVPYLQFDPTGMIFLALSLVVCVGGSLLIAFILDKTHLSLFIFGKRKVISPFAENKQ